MMNRPPWREEAQFSERIGPWAGSQTRFHPRCSGGPHRDSQWVLAADECQVWSNVLQTLAFEISPAKRNLKVKLQV